MSSDVAACYGPGRLVLVVGPSGAGKDTLIRLAREQLDDNGGIVFPRRVVTRESSAWEDHDTVSPTHFEAGLRTGLYPIHWAAHGLRYGLPASILTDVAAGRTVVANVSRHVVAEARRSFAHVSVCYVTAPPDVLAARLAHRGREAADSGRLARAAPGPEGCDADLVIENVGLPMHEARRLLALLRSA